MRLQIEFKYQSEIIVDKKDVSKIIDDLNKDKSILELSEEINKILSEKDLKIVVGGVTNINYTIEED